MVNEIIDSACTSISKTILNKAIAATPKCMKFPTAIGLLYIPPIGLLFAIQFKNPNLIHRALSICNKTIVRVFVFISRPITISFEKKG